MYCSFKHWKKFIWKDVKFKILTFMSIHLFFYINWLKANVEFCTSNKVDKKQKKTLIHHFWCSDFNQTLHKKIKITLSAGHWLYHLLRGKTSPPKKGYPGYDTKLHLMVRLQIWGAWSTWSTWSTLIWIHSTFCGSNRSVWTLFVWTMCKKKQLKKQLPNKYNS